MKLGRWDGMERGEGKQKEHEMKWNEGDDLILLGDYPPE